MGCTIIISKYVILPTDNQASLQMIVCLALGFCCRSCCAVEVGWRMSLPLCFIKSNFFPFMPPHPNLLLIHSMTTQVQWTFCLFIFTWSIQNREVKFSVLFKNFCRYSPTKQPKHEWDLDNYIFGMHFNHFYYLVFKH